MLVTVAAYGLLNTVSATDPETSATIKTELPMLSASSVGLSLNGGLTVTSPDNIPGYWEIKGHGYFSDSKEEKFCLLKTIGIQEFIFIPNDPNAKASSVYSIVFVWRAHITEIILVLITITLIIAIYMSTKTSSVPQKEKFTAT